MKIRFALYLLILYSCNVNPKEPDIKPKFPVIAQSSKHLKSGDQLEIDVWVKPLKDSLNPKIKINGIDVPINPNGLMMFVKQIHGTPGEYSIPIKIINYYGNNETKVENYTVNYFVDK